MTQAEWWKQVTILQARWPHKEITEQSAELWFHDLADLPVAQVEAGITSLYRDGREWPPNGAQIRERVSELGRDVKDHGAAYQLAMKAASSKGFERGLDWLREQDRLVALAAERFPWRSLCQEQMEDGTRRAQFRDVYKAVAEEDRRDAAYAGIPDAGLRGLERRPKSMREVLDRALPQGNVVELQPGEAEDEEAA